MLLMPVLLRTGLGLELLRLRMIEWLLYFFADTHEITLEKLIFIQVFCWSIYFTYIKGDVFDASNLKTTWTFENSPTLLSAFIIPCPCYFQANFVVLNFYKIFIGSFYLDFSGSKIMRFYRFIVLLKLTYAVPVWNEPPRLFSYQHLWFGLVNN